MIRENKPGQCLYLVTYIKMMLGPKDILPPTNDGGRYDKTDGWGRNSSPGISGGRSGCRDKI